MIKRNGKNDRQLPALEKPYICMGYTTTCNILQAKMATGALHNLLQDPLIRLLHIIVYFTLGDTLRLFNFRNK